MALICRWAEQTNLLLNTGRTLSDWRDGLTEMSMAYSNQTHAHISKRALADRKLIPR
jgi:hypothetical protein